jgi:broad-like protein
MADDQQFCLRWNDFQQNMVASFKNLREEQSFCDVTIATEVGIPPLGQSSACRG